MIPTSLSHLAELAAKATPGPWEYDEREHEIVVSPRPSPLTGGVVTGGSLGHENALLGCSEDDARYLAACSPAAILALVERIRELSEGLKEALGYYTEAADDAGPLRECDKNGRIAQLRTLAGEP